MEPSFKLSAGVVEGCRHWIRGKCASGVNGLNMEPMDDPEYQNLLERISRAYSKGRLSAYQAVNVHLINTYWQIGHDIVEYEQGGKARAEYGAALITRL